MKIKVLILSAVALSTLNPQFSTLCAQGTAFTYQGRLSDGSNPATGLYDFRCGVYDAALSGSAVAAVLTNTAVTVSNGLFTLTLDFGGSVFTGNPRWLDLAVRPNSGGAFTALAPRQPLTPTPYAMYTATAFNAGTANFAYSSPASGLVGTMNLSQLPPTVITNNSTGVTLAGAFSGSGAGITNVNADLVDGQHGAFYQNAANLNSGTLADARLSANIPLLNANQTFGGSNRFAGVVTLTNAANTIAGTFTGNASGLTSLNASQLASGSVPLGLLPGAVVTNNETGLNLSGTFSGNGAGVTNVNLLTANDQGAINWTTNWGAFSLSSSPGVGSMPEALIAADVNGDGRMDLISANISANTLSVLTNNGSGGFVLAATLIVGSGPNALAAADVNGDGKLDLISANNSANALSVLTNNGSGGFTLASTLALGTGPYSVVAADINGDGSADLISANGVAGTLTVLTNNGSGVFTFRATLGVGAVPYCVIAADVNGDANLDLISANYSDWTLSVLTNNGSGGFALASTPSGGITYPRCVTAADVNGDGKLDLISANYGNNTLSVLLGNGNGGFVVSSSPAVGSSPKWVTAADLNGDGKVDLISANRGANTLSVLTNNGSGGFVVAASPGVGSLPSSVVASDVNGDGKPDLISANYSGNSLSVLFNVPAGYKGLFTGDGSGLSSLNASQLTAGTVALARLPGAVLTNNASSVALAGSFTGNGAGLTNLDATDLVGTVADAKLSANVALLNTNQTFSGSNRFAGVVTLTNPANNLGGAFAGDGSGLTNLNANQLTSGTVPLNRLPGAVVTNNATGLSLAGTFSGSGTLSGTFSGGGTLTGSFSGNGSGLTNLNANQLATGTVPLARLPTTLVTNNEAGVTLTGTFSGNGGGLTNLPGLAGWQTVSGTNQTASPNAAYLLTSSAQVTVTLPPSPELGDVLRVSGAGMGGWRIAQNAGQLILTANLPGNAVGAHWAARTGTQNWTGVASSADGAKLVGAAYGGQIWVSTDWGATWTGRSTGRNWNAVACSTDGTKLVAMVDGGQIWTSADSGTNWTAHAINTNWVAIASSADGTKLVAAGYPANIYTSSDSGVTWTARATSVYWKSVASSADGTKLMAGVNGGPIYTSSDSGTNWTPRASSQIWQSIASSADGTKLVAAAYGGQIWASTDSGTNWTARAISTNWMSLASSADGTRLTAAVTGGQIWISPDSGANWTACASSLNWRSVACSADGTKLVAAVAYSQIYTSLPGTTSGASGYLTGAQYGAIELQYVGNGLFIPLSHEGNILAR